MALDNPIAIYFATTRQEAEFLCDVLTRAGIEAHLMGASIVDSCGHGSPRLSQLPEVWVDLADQERAEEILQKYEELVKDRQLEPAKHVDGEVLVQAVCEECGAASMFSGQLLGSVQECPHCGAFMDVEASDDRAASDEDWEDDEGDKGGEES